MSYHDDIFYDVYDLCISEKIEILEWCRGNATRWAADILEPGSIARVKIDISWDDMIAKLDDDSHFVFIYRRGHDESRADDINWRIEAGFRASSRASDYFLFVWVPEDKLEEAIERFKLKAI